MGLIYILLLHVLALKGTYTNSTDTFGEQGQHSMCTDVNFRLNSDLEISRNIQHAAL